MSVYRVNGSDLGDIAEAIREKGGTSAPLTFPGGFVSAIGAISGSNPGKHVYGVRWTYEDDGNGGKQLASSGTGTDEAADFGAPVPFIAGESQMSMIQSALSCGSPYDDLYPWSGMLPYKDRLLGHMVAIPKYWYKWTKSASYLQLQIATYAAPGFHLSPAHRARSANDHERDVVYLARYRSGQTLASFSGDEPLRDLTRGKIRTAISSQLSQLGLSGYSMQDYAMFWTWRMLFLCEYKNWNGQAAIGFGCGTGDDISPVCPRCSGSGTDPETGETCETCNGTGQNPEHDPDAQSAPFNNGTTDNMPYHTGTMNASLATPGQGVQYRYIEDPWGGVAEFIDGWYMAADAESGEGYCCVILDPAAYSDTEGGVEIYRGTAAPSGWITDWAFPETEGYDWALLPVAGNGGGPNTSVADYCSFRGPALYSGGDWIADPWYGPFFLRAVAADYRGAVFGARLQKLP